MIKRGSYLLGALVCGVLIGVGSADLVAQMMQLSDGTWATKAVLYSAAGVEQSIGGGTQYAEDAAHVSGNTGNLLLAVRQDTQADFAADGDYVPLSIDADGALRVAGGGGGTQYAEDAVHASGNTGTLALVVRNDAGTALAADGDNIPLMVNSAGSLYVAGTGTFTVSATNLDVQIGGSDTVTVAATNLDVQIGGSDTVTISSDDQQAEDNAIAYALTLPAVVNLMYCDNATQWVRCPLGDAGSGTIGTNTSRITVATDDPVNDALVNLDLALVVEDLGETADNQLLGIGTVRRNAAASSAGATGDNATLNTDALGLLWARQQDPCSGVAKSYFQVDIVTATTVEIANAVASEFFYICSINLVTAGANNVVIAEDDTDGCGSISAGVTGGTTAGEGWNFAANGGIAIGGGNAAVAKTTTANRYLCILTSAAQQLSGSISYVSAP